MSLKEAEEKLAAMEQHLHASATAHFRMKRSERLMHEYADEPDVAARHKADFEKHAADKAASQEAHRASGATTKDIDQAAQAVLDERKEVHSDHPEYVAPVEITQ